MTELKYPGMRSELLYHLAHLADADYQRRVWVGRQYPKPGYYDDFSETFEAIEDIINLSDTQAAVGMTVVDNVEASALGRLGAVIDDIFDAYGTQLSDAQYMALPEWRKVLAAAAAAHALLQAGDDAAHDYGPRGPR